MATRDITLKGLTDLELELLCRWINEAPTTPYAPMLARIQRQLPLDTETAECDRYIERVTLHQSAAAPSSADRAPLALSLPRRAEGGVSQAMRQVFETSYTYTQPNGEAL